MKTEIKDLTSKETSMLSGNLWKQIFFFSMPLMFSQILQVLFNMADIAVVGKFGSDEALGSVGSTSMLVFLFTGFLFGLGAGVNVRVAQHLGAGNKKDVRETVHTSLILCFGAGVLITVLCLLLAEPLLTLLGTKDDLLDGAILYFRIYAIGMPALGVFCFGNGVLSAEGDTRRPLIYLIVAGVLNVILNLVFVIGCKMQADGVAYASAISQFVPAVLVVVRLMHRDSDCRFEWKYLSFSRAKAQSVIVLGVPAGIQNALFAIANLFVQSGVNTFASVVVEGNSASANGDTIVYNIMSAFYTACSSYMGQNWGAKKYDRVKKTYVISLLYAVIGGATGGALLYVFRYSFLGLFTNDTAVIEAAIPRLIVMAVSYWIAPFMDCTIAASRGLGRSMWPTFIVIMGSCVFRVVWVYTVFAHFQTLTSLYMLYMFSWTITAIAEIAYFIYAFRKLTKTE